MKTLFQAAEKITNNFNFKGFIISLIILSAIIIGLETYHGFASRYSDLLFFLDRLIIYLFVLEILLKLLASGPKVWRFFTDPWNVFDFVIVAVCLIPAVDTHFVAVLRIARVLRLLRMISVFPKLRVLIGALLKSIPSMGYVIVLLMLLFYVYAILGVFLYGASDPTHFGNLHLSMITLFKVITLEGWTDIMNTHLYIGNNEDNIASLWPFIYFASFIVIGAMIIMNLFIGVIMKSMEESQAEMNRELGEIKASEKSSDEQLNLILSRLDDLRNDVQNLKNIKNKL